MIVSQVLAARRQLSLPLPALQSAHDAAAAQLAALQAAHAADTAAVDGAAAAERVAEADRHAVRYDHLAQQVPQRQLLFMSMSI